MTRLNAIVFVAACLGLAFVLPAAAQTAGPAGMWRVQFATPLGQRTVSMTINQSGNRLSGQVTDEYGEYPIEGEFRDSRVTVKWSVSEEGKMLEIIMKGTLKGDEIVGTAALGDVGEGALVARRTGDAGDQR
ncbi:MAG TPA: hypothetical protein VH583_02645 [Vicinamibacterales bacterium]|jgi:hypothetical protein